MIPQETLENIYMEAGLFVLVILIMSIISYKISSKNAKEYAIKNQKKIDVAKEEKAKSVKSKEARIVELQKVFSDGMITEDEFKMMKNRLYSTREEE